MVQDELAKEGLRQLRGKNLIEAFMTMDSS